MTKEHDRLYGEFSSGLHTELTWAEDYKNSTFTLRNVGYDVSCINNAFAAVDGTQAIFTFKDEEGHALCVEFPGFTWRTIVYTYHPETSSKGEL